MMMKENQISADSDKFEMIDKFTKIHICKQYPNKMKVSATLHMLEISKILEW